jgi:hypothetical protein
MLWKWQYIFVTQALSCFVFHLSNLLLTRNFVYPTLFSSAPPPSSANTSSWQVVRTALLQVCYRFVTTCAFLHVCILYCQDLTGLIILFNWFIGARICAEVCQHRCLPSCEWSCCIKENIEEYRQAHLVKPLVPHPSIQRKSDLAKVGVVKDPATVGKVRSRAGKSRQNIEEPLKDGKDCNVSCKRYCVPSCRFACCQAVQIRGVLLL